MGRAISLREDFDNRQLGRLAQQSAESNQTRRLLVLSVIYDGGSRWGLNSENWYKSNFLKIGITPKRRRA